MTVAAMHNNLYHLYFLSNLRKFDSKVLQFCSKFLFVCFFHLG